MIRRCRGVPGSAFTRAIATVFIARATTEEVESLVGMEALSAAPDIAAGLHRIIGEIEVRACLEKVNCAGLVMHGAGDQVQSPEQPRQIVRTLPRGV
jgi:pimeloyl-ACP methyl ester carboxylesterase